MPWFVRMYVVPIIVPIFVDGARKYVHSDWARGLHLLRDSLSSRYGRLVIAAPWLPATDAQAGEQTLEQIGAGEDIELLPMFDWRTRAREFWLHEVRRVRAQLEALLSDASVVHAGMDDLYRPMMNIASFCAFRRDLPVILVQDTDTVTQIREVPTKTAVERAKDAAYLATYERVGRRLVAQASLALLKGKQLMQRYARYARCAREFHNTSYLASEVIPQSVVAVRLTTLHHRRPLRLVYCGRLVARKGIDDSVRIVARALELGADVTLDVIGSGPCDEALRRQIEGSGLAAAVRMIGPRPYGPTLLRELANYDAMLFSPASEDTPRMIFDGYAAGLPLLAADIPYVQERAAEDGATILLPRAAPEAAAARLVQLDHHREQLIGLTHAALRAATHHAADTWYQRRAQWTHEAVDRARFARSSPRHAFGDM